MVLRRIPSYRWMKLGALISRTAASPPFLAGFCILRRRVAFGCGDPQPPTVCYFGLGVAGTDVMRGDEALPRQAQ
jgi:hypothetical protein